MKKIYNKKITIPAVFALSSIMGVTLYGCSLGESSTSSRAGLSSGSSSEGLSGRVSAGPLKNGTISIYLLTNTGEQGALLAQATTEADGSFNIPTIAPQSNPILIVASGGNYSEEASGSSVEMGSARMRLVLANISPGQIIGVSPITEIAAQTALAQVSSGNATVVIAIHNANGTVANAFGLSDITIPPANPNVSARGASTEATQYALALGGISHMAKNAGGTANSLSVMQALANSFAYTGSVNGLAQGQAIPIPGAALGYTLQNLVGTNGEDFQAHMREAIRTFVASAQGNKFTDGETNKVPAPTAIATPESPAGMDALVPPAVPAAGFSALPPTQAGAPALPSAPSFMPPQAVSTGYCVNANLNQCRKITAGTLILIAAEYGCTNSGGSWNTSGCTNEETIVGECTVLRPDGVTGVVTTSYSPMTIQIAQRGCKGPRAIFTEVSN